MPQFTCRGPLPDGAAEHIAELINDGELDEAQRIDAVNRGLKKANLTGTVKVEGLDDEGNIVESEVQAPAGPGCGADLDELILSLDQDDVERERACPKCGARFRVRRTVVEPEEG